MLTCIFNCKKEIKRLLEGKKPHQLEDNKVFSDSKEELLIDQ